MSARPWEYTIESDDWDAAARELITTINGVGYFHFDGLQDALDSGPYRDSREFVMKHLGHMKRSPARSGNRPGSAQHEAQLRQ